MARHIFTVCVVCLLCAHHLPCASHFAPVIPDVNAKLDADLRNAGANSIHNPSKQTTDRHNEKSQLPMLEPSPSPSSSPTPLSSLELAYRGYTETAESNKHRLRRQKRHAGGDHAHEDERSLPPITEQALKFLLNNELVGNAANSSNSSKAAAFTFQQLLARLGLPNLSITKNNTQCLDDRKLMQLVRRHDHHAHKPDHGQTNPQLSKEDLLNVCPVLLYQIASPEPTARSGCPYEELLSAVEHDSQTNGTTSRSFVPVWFWSTISVTSCSVLGLVGIAIIPIMETRYYKPILDFLVSLAIGTLSGDALLHLFPHALAGQNEQGMTLKGLASMGGIMFFYAAENFFTMVSESRKNAEKKKTKKPPCAKIVRDPDSSVNNSVTGDRMCKQKYSSYPYCYDELNVDNKKDVWLHMPNNGDLAASDSKDREPITAAAQALLSKTHAVNYAEMNHHHHHGPADCNTQSSNPTLMTNGVLNDKDRPEETVTVIVREHESVHHGHSHRHGHVHSPPNCLKSVVWMIIMGDGLHNFTDGMAIGAAFSENIAGGFSTAVAVFCHELPHELGDFAILIKAGMTVKVAVMYNLLTSVLSFVGMIFGILYGQTKDAAQWMFAVAAGLFIYIALVDMMPEISTAHKSCKQIVRQVLGIGTGVFIMFLIAVYEGQLATILPTVY